ncbi:MAG: hypothetical protein ACYSUN_08785 [Planctomycetota bacterium]|jgi:hypothetical protein
MRPLLAALLIVQVAAADAIVVTRAMTATTIAEIYVAKDGIRVELEIGVSDLKAFHNILPDELRTRLGLEAAPLDQRVPRFFAEDWVLKADGKPLGWKIEEIQGRRRIRRDEITGETIGESEETVVFLAVRYPLAERPKTLSIRPPSAEGGVTANVGFLVYHEGLPVNDFRYLGKEETVDLDWKDPWFSKFRNRNLRRKYSSPIQAFLYVDHFEVRKEIIVRPKDLQRWVDLGLEGKEIIPAGEQAELKRKVAEFLASRNPVTIDGSKARGELDRIHFVRRTLRMTGVIDPPEDLPTLSATLGVIFVYPVQALPQKATMRWELFGERIEKIPTVATDEAGGLPSYVTPDDPELVWQNFLTNPSRPTLVDIAPPPAGGPALPVVSIGVALFALLALLRRRRVLFAIGIVAALALWPLVRFPLTGPGELGDQPAKEVLSGLLQNVYRAFDFRGEGAIYDTLERSASGDLLTRIYLETRRALELQNQGGARAKVKKVEILKTETAPLEEGVGFRSRCTWNVAGSVGHWGHIHQRRNQYEAEFQVRPVDGVWKITGLELLGERRL